MLSLALDTSTSLGSVALERDGELLAESSLSVRAAHSETVLPEIRRLLERCGAPAREVDRVVVGAGPGSFTGVRIAASLAKGLCAATGADLAAYSGLAALAAGTGASGPVCALLDARRDEVYAAAWPAPPGREAPAAGEELLEPTAAPVAEVLERLGGGEGWIFAGAGAATHRPELEAAGGRVLSFLHAAPRGAALLHLAAERPGDGRVEDPAAWEPAYVRASGAERGV